VIRIVKTGDSRIEEFNARPAFPQAAEDAAFKTLADIRKNGDKAVRKYVAKFEGYKGGELKVDVGDLKIPAKIAAAVKDAHRRVMKFSKASLREAWTMKTPGGGKAGEFYSPMDRVGVYVPGGTAPLASTSIMTVTLAKAAGVPLAANEWDRLNYEPRLPGFGGSDSLDWARFLENLMAKGYKYPFVIENEGCNSSHTGNMGATMQGFRATILNTAPVVWPLGPAGYAYDTSAMKPMAVTRSENLPVRTMADIS
jgi:hypothetical protein